MSEDEFEDMDVEEEDLSGYDADDEPEGGFKLGKLLVLVGIIVLQIAMAYGVAHFLILPRLPGGDALADSLAESAVPEEKSGPKERGTIVMIEDIVVNVQDIERSRLLMVSAALEFSAKGLGEEITERMPELRAMVIDHLTNNQVAELVHREGRDRVKQDLLESMNEVLRSGDLLNIYFSNFVVQ